MFGGGGGGGGGGRARTSWRPLVNELDFFIHTTNVIKGDFSLLHKVAIASQFFIKKA